MLDFDPSYQVLRFGFKVLGSESLFGVTVFFFFSYDSPWVPAPVGGLGCRHVDIRVISVSSFYL